MTKKYLSTLPLDHAPPFGLIVHTLFICSLLALILQVKNVVSLLLVLVGIKGVQLTCRNLDFIFSGNNLFLSVRLIMFNTGL